MSDAHLNYRLGRLAAAMDGSGPEVKAAGGRNNGKAKPKPPWLDDEQDDDEDDEDVPPKRRKPVPGKPGLKPGGKPMPGGGGTRKPASKAYTPPSGSSGQRKRRNNSGIPAGSKAAARPTVWGPPNQRVDITRADTDHVGSDARVNREARRRFYDDTPSYGTGPAGGNGATAGRGGNRAPTRTPGNVRGRSRRNEGDSPVGEMGEGAAWGRSGSAMHVQRPPNVRGGAKGLYDYSPEQVRAALDVATKALTGVLHDHDERED